MTEICEQKMQGGLLSNWVPNKSQNKETLL